MKLHYHSEKRKLVNTSFGDRDFLQHLINAIRFGLPLLVQDVEKIDPFLNSVLNKEVYKKGGRVLMRVGDQEVEYFDTFKMYMITRD
jgi:dynein heavy chain 1